jgi:hypothetical protein
MVDALGIEPPCEGPAQGAAEIVNLKIEISDLRFQMEDAEGRGFGAVSGCVGRREAASAQRKPKAWRMRAREGPARAG